MASNNPYIISEIGSNWTSLQDCLDSIIQAKLAGADAVKFQLFNHHALYGSGDGFNDPATPMAGSLPELWLPKLKLQCDRLEIDFMCSAFSPELVAAVDPFVKTHKIASSEMCHLRILEKLKEIGKPVIMSTGAQTVQDIASALIVLGKTPVTLMYCVSSYPAYETDLHIIREMRHEFTLPVGFSDHSLDYLNLPSLAVNVFSATVIEKHFTAIDAKTPDSGHSLNPDQFKKMVQKIRGEYQSVVGPTLGEKDMILKHKRRLIAIRDIEIGDVFKEGYNFGIYRSLKENTHAYSPFAVDTANEQTALRSIKAGDGVGPGDF